MGVDVERLTCQGNRMGSYAVLARLLMRSKNEYLVGPMSEAEMYLLRDTFIGYIGERS